MLPRVLEPEVMDSAEEARAYDAMDHAQVNRLFVADFLAHWSGPGLVLDVGTGTAQIPIELCRQCPSVAVLAIDLAGHMLELAGENIRQAGLENRIQLQCCDAKAIRFPDETFAAVMSNSIVHHIPDPGRVLAEMVRLTQKGGLLFVRDLLRPVDEATVGQFVNTYAAAANDYQRGLFADSLRAALTMAEMTSLIGELGFPPATLRQTSDRHWTWVARNQD